MKEKEAKPVRIRVAKGTADNKRQMLQEEAMRRQAEEEERARKEAEEEAYRKSVKEAEEAIERERERALEEERLAREARRRKIEPTDKSGGDDDVVVTRHMRHKNRSIVATDEASSYNDKLSYDTGSSYGAESSYDTDSPHGKGSSYNEDAAYDSGASVANDDHVNFTENRELPWDKDDAYRTGRRKRNMAALAEGDEVSYQRPRSKAATIVVLCLEAIAIIIVLSIMFHFKNKLDKRDFGVENTYSSEEESEMEEPEMEESEMEESETEEFEVDEEIDSESEDDSYEE